jgi:hypothetical protein
MLIYNPTSPVHWEPWNKRKLVGPKPPFKLHVIWAIRIRLDIERRVRELAMSNLAVDSKLRGYDLVRLKFGDVMHGRHAVSRTLVVQHKTQQPVRFEITEQTRDAIEAWVNHASLNPVDHCFQAECLARRISQRASMPGLSNAGLR